MAPFERDASNVYQKPEPIDPNSNRISDLLNRMLEQARDARQIDPDVRAAYQRDIRRRRREHNPEEDLADYYEMENAQNEEPARPGSPLLTWAELLAEIDNGGPSPEVRAMLQRQRERAEVIELADIVVQLKRFRDRLAESLAAARGINMTQQPYRLPPRRSPRIAAIALAQANARMARAGIAPQPQESEEDSSDEDDEEQENQEDDCLVVKLFC